ncbi:TetR/AcrR family transcriptional regulator [Fusobacterium sp.]|uniref:TetR/AcrR family transcriptional regulator n=1 Tax=Fusobacterium sp. TaxID=68766 RepID=UPI00396C634E
MDKKKEIINGAKALVLKRGYKNVSVEDITNHIGIAKGSFYTYFKSKNSLINYILEEKVVKIKRKMNSFFKNVNNIDEAIEKLVKIKLVLKNEDDIKSDLMMVSFFRNIDSLDKETVKIFFEMETVSTNFIQKILMRYQDELKIKKSEMVFYSKMIHGLITNYKVFDLFISKERDFISTTVELEKKYKTVKFKNDMEIIVRSIIKILK